MIVSGLIRTDWSPSSSGETQSSGYLGTSWHETSFFQINDVPVPQIIQYVMCSWTGWKDHLIVRKSYMRLYHHVTIKESWNSAHNSLGVDSLVFAVIWVRTPVSKMDTITGQADQQDTGGPLTNWPTLDMWALVSRYTWLDKSRRKSRRNSSLSTQRKEWQLDSLDIFEISEIHRTVLVFNEELFVEELLRYQAQEKDSVKQTITVVVIIVIQFFLESS